jgi:hypothetical protein
MRPEDVAVAEVSGTRGMKNFCTAFVCEGILDFSRCSLKPLEIKFRDKSGWNDVDDKKKSGQ